MYIEHLFMYVLSTYDIHLNSNNCEQKHIWIHKTKYGSFSLMIKRRFWNNIDKCQSWFYSFWQKLDWHHLLNAVIRGIQLCWRIVASLACLICHSPPNPPKYWQRPFRIKMGLPIICLIFFSSTASSPHKVRVIPQSLSSFIIILLGLPGFLGSPKS